MALIELRRLKYASNYPKVPKKMPRRLNFQEKKRKLFKNSWPTSVRRLFGMIVLC